MASGLAVISTACGGPATAVVQGETGLLTPVGDAPALAAAMETILRDSTLRERMGREGDEWLKSDSLFLLRERFSLIGMTRSSVSVKSSPSIRH